MMQKILLPLLALSIVGCVAVNDTYEYAKFADNVGRNAKGVSIGFSGNLFKVEEMYLSGGTAYAYRHGPFVTTSGWTEKVQIKDPFADYVINTVEEHGYIVRAQQPKFILQLDGFVRRNIQKPGDFWLPYLCSVTFLDRLEISHSLRVKLYDNSNGELIYDKTFTHDGSKLVLKLMPLFTDSVYTTRPEYLPEYGCVESWYRAALDDLFDYLKKNSL